MTYNEYISLIAKCASTDHIAEYGFPAKVFDIIFAVSRCDFKKLVNLAGGNLSALSRLLNIPIRTAQSWLSGEREPSEYIVQLIGFALISQCEKEYQ